VPGLDNLTASFGIDNIGNPKPDKRKLTELITEITVLFILRMLICVFESLDVYEQDE